MGCAQSRVDNEESVSRCKERRNLMKEAVLARNAFASAHSSYAVALKNTGAALSDYGHGETEENPQLLHNTPMDPTAEPPPPPPPMDTLPPPPPPLPNFSPSPLKRAMTMPEDLIKINRGKIAIENGSIAEGEEEERDEGVGRERGEKGLRGRRQRKNEVDEVAGSEVDKWVPQRTPEQKAVPPMPESKGMAWDYFFMVDSMPGPGLGGENENLEEIDENAEEREFGDSAENVGGDGVEEAEPKTPEKVEEKVEKQIEHSKTAPPEFRRVAEKVASSVSLMQILNMLDEHFLKASQSAQEVSTMLEATRIHYHSNFADNRGHIDHSARVMRVITWNKSSNGVRNSDGRKDDFDSEEYETHATVLDKVLAWEKKLYEEVKQGELMKLEYQRKVALLNKQKKRSASAESLAKTKSAVSHLHTRYIVDMQSMDTTVSEVNRLRDEQLYPKLVSLVNGMARMWESMCIHHESQLKIVTDLKSLDIAYAPKETTKHHHEQTIQLSNIVQEWHLQFEKLVTYQKQYIQTLHSWLKLNLIPIESTVKEKTSSPPRIQNPPIQVLIRSWNEYLEKLPDELAKSALSSFAAVIKTIIIHQDEEIKLKEKCEETRREFLRKNQAFEEWYQKHMQRHGGDEMDPERGEDGSSKDRISDKQFVVETLRKKLEEEVEAHQKHCVQVREKSLGSLKTRLPEIFRAMTDYARSCSDAYGKLRLIAHPENTNGGLH